MPINDSNKELYVISRIPSKSQIKTREHHSYPAFHLVWNIYTMIHFVLVLFTYEAVSIFRDVST